MGPPFSSYTAVSVCSLPISELFLLSKLSRLSDNVLGTSSICLPHCYPSSQAHPLSPLFTTFMWLFGSLGLYSTMFPSISHHCSGLPSLRLPLSAIIVAILHHNCSSCCTQSDFIAVVTATGLHHGVLPAILLPLQQKLISLHCCSFFAISVATIITPCVSCFVAFIVPFCTDQPPLLVCLRHRNCHLHRGLCLMLCTFIAPLICSISTLNDWLHSRLKDWLYGSGPDAVWFYF